MARLWLLTALLAAALLGWAPPVAAADGCSDLGGTRTEDGLCRTHEARTDYELNIAFPVDYPDQGAITEFVTTTRDRFVETAQDRRAHNRPYRMEIQATEHRTETTRSVAFEVYQNVGGAHPSSWYQTFNYDLARQRPLTFETLFAPETRPLDAIYPLVQRALADRLDVADPVSPKAGLDAANYQSFAVTPEELIFYFDRGVLMAGAAGAHAVALPRDQLPPLAL
ncbi:esterase [[Mycobacterium] wendilense]|uniref:RsiV family protein n=1 Tax=[Mycobacterium] wendilense TaxID=3064284 RepID=A0ABN9P7H5_9MYCO|nr:esterase [Mycolicibacterium sp. MU0050]CAJ1584171.1 RsiV family protein [Mycolicibacterium sp. MU0050]